MRKFVGFKRIHIYRSLVESVLEIEEAYDRVEECLTDEGRRRFFNSNNYGNLKTEDSRKYDKMILEGKSHETLVNILTESFNTLFEKVIIKDTDGHDAEIKVNGRNYPVEIEPANYFQKKSVKNLDHKRNSTENHGRPQLNEQMDDKGVLYGFLFDGTRMIFVYRHKEEPLVDVNLKKNTDSIRGKISDLCDKFNKKNVNRVISENGDLSDKKRMERLVDLIDDTYEVENGKPKLIADIVSLVYSGQDWNLEEKKVERKVEFNGIEKGERKVIEIKGRKHYIKSETDVSTLKRYISDHDWKSDIDDCRYITRRIRNKTDMKKREIRDQEKIVDILKKYDFTEKDILFRNTSPNIEKKILRYYYADNVKIEKDNVLKNMYDVFRNFEESETVENPFVISCEYSSKQKDSRNLITDHNEGISVKGLHVCHRKRHWKTYRDEVDADYIMKSKNQVFIVKTGDNSSFRGYKKYQYVDEDKTVEYKNPMKGWRTASEEKKEYIESLDLSFSFKTAKRGNSVRNKTEKMKADIEIKEDDSIEFTEGEIIENGYWWRIKPEMIDRLGTIDSDKYDKITVIKDSKEGRGGEKISKYQEEFNSEIQAVYVDRTKSIERSNEIVHPSSFVPKEYDIAVPDEVMSYDTVPCYKSYYVASLMTVVTGTYYNYYYNEKSDMDGARLEDIRVLHHKNVDQIEEINSFSNELLSCWKNNKHKKMFDLLYLNLIHLDGKYSSDLICDIKPRIVNQKLNEYEGKILSEIENDYIVEKYREIYG